ncbi:hypothetical protein [Streptomyces sp. NBC_00989]|uniref:hypothetical protein n=1 Tax=Streptomyces sp. NBC_00989 TaxID=2903705 RepID=UPI00386ACB90|nr:hypothetical protein OG714_01065 [Streptomyces sp. NBC_00989]
MAPQLRMLGTIREEGKCQRLYEDLNTGGTVVQGYPVTDHDDVAQIQNVLDGESFGGGSRDEC